MRSSRYEYCALPPLFVPGFTELEFTKKTISPSVLTLPILEKPSNNNIQNILMN